jgi:hypothetical protein
MTRKKSPNHYTIYSGDNKHILFEKDGRVESEIITGGSGRVLSEEHSEENK